MCLYFAGGMGAGRVVGGVTWGWDLTLCCPELQLGAQPGSLANTGKEEARCAFPPQAVESDSRSRPHAGLISLCREVSGWTCLDWSAWGTLLPQSCPL